MHSASQEPHYLSFLPLSLSISLSLSHTHTHTHTHTQTHTMLPLSCCCCCARPPQIRGEGVLPSLALQQPTSFDASGRPCLKYGRVSRTRPSTQRINFKNNGLIPASARMEWVPHPAFTLLDGPQVRGTRCVAELHCCTVLCMCMLVLLCACIGHVVCMPALHASLGSWRVCALWLSCTALLCAFPHPPPGRAGACMYLACTQAAASTLHTRPCSWQARCAHPAAASRRTACMHAHEAGHVPQPRALSAAKAPPDTSKPVHCARNPSRRPGPHAHRCA